MKKQYFLFLLIFPVLGLFAASYLYIGTQVKDWLNDLVSQELQQKARLVSSMLRETNQAMTIDNLNPLIRELNSNSEYRITVIDRNGVVLADSALNTDEVYVADDHKDRPEIIAAHESEKAEVAIHYSEVTRSDRMYVALPVNNRNWQGFVRVSINLSQTAEYISQVKNIIIWVGATTMLALAVVLFIVFKYMDRNNEKNRIYLEKRVKARTDDLLKIQKFGEMLTTCQKLDEVAEIVNLTLPSILPNTSGALSIIHPSMDTNEVVTTWGEKWAGLMVFAPGDCWAFRRGAEYCSNENDIDLCCKHLDTKDLTICIPLAAQGNSLGALHVTVHKGEVEQIKQFITSVVDHLGVSLFSINLRESLNHQAVRDSLTNLYNRRYLDESLPRELERAIRRKNYVGVMMVDVDHYKKFNDTYGHEAGDVVLQKLGALFTKVIRKEDLACRYGGEEFVLVMSDASIETITKRAETLLQQVRELELTHKNKSLGNITISIGISIFPKHNGDAEELLSIADKALYEAKSNGRDQIQIAPMPSTPNILITDKVDAK